MSKIKTMAENQKPKKKVVSKTKKESSDKPAPEWSTTKQVTESELLGIHRQLVSDLKSKNYFEISRRITSNPSTIDLLHAAMGITTEAGELVDILKRAFFYGTPPDPLHILEEIGDLLFYIELACQAMETNSSQARVSNIQKLNKRYSSGQFTEKEAVERNLEDEKEALDNSVVKS